jgi:hypothetical protein
MATVESEGQRVPFNKSATRWLGVWLDSQLTLKDHRRAMLKKGRKAMAQIRRLAGKLGFTPSNYRKVMSACVQSVAMYGSELWWRGIGSRAADLQKLVNQEAWTVTGCSRSTNIGALAMESAL